MTATAHLLLERGRYPNAGPAVTQRLTGRDATWQAAHMDRIAEELQAPARLDDIIIMS
ncbi:MAG: hypothetical protein ABR529_07010 [Actinomycetota bacterium]